MIKIKAILRFSFIVSIQSQVIVSNYSSELTFNNGKYIRDGAPSGSNYYYATVEVRVNTTGTYTFTSSSSIGDTFGYLYQGNFYPTYPSINIVTTDDDSAGQRQFQLTATLRSDITYILVFTTFAENQIGSFSIVASGPDNVFNPIGVPQSCPMNEVSYENHCYYLDGIGGQCSSGYSLGSEEMLAQVANLFLGMNYKTAISDNCCVKTTASTSNWGMGGTAQCNTQGPFTGVPTLNGAGCRDFANNTPGRQLTFCASD